MKLLNHIPLLLVVGLFFTSCEKDVRNIAGEYMPAPNPIIEPLEITPVNVNEEGLDLLDNMQGQWVGNMNIINDEIEWFAFDYRAISPSHTFGIFEGGSAGNLLTSFFVADFKDTRTIMARNGGLLNGIYRSSYFVLDSTSTDSNSQYYRLVDAVGGTSTMYMELRFVADSLYFNAYTSRLGLFEMPTRHMTFKSSRWNDELASTAATEFGYPVNTPAWDFSDGFNEDYLYVNSGDESAKSATFLSYQDGSNDVFSLATESGDPWTISEQPHLGLLQVNIDRGTEIEGKRLFLYLSNEPLTDADGYFVGGDSFGSVLRFPELEANVDDFLFTYLHPGSYYVSVIADVNEDGFISEGDITHSVQQILIDTEGEHEINISDITVVN